jgi:AraC-like DNA-binding protein
MMDTPLRQQFAFRSESLRTEDAIAQWQEEISATDDVFLHADEPFYMDCAFVRCGPIVISRGTYSGQTFVRKRSHIQRDHLDHCGVIVQATGRRITHTQGRETLLKPYDLKLFDLAQEEVSTASGGNSGSIYMPRDLMESVIPDFGRRHGELRSDPAARLLAQHIMVMLQYVPHIPDERLPAFIESTIEMVFNTLEHAPIEAADTAAQQELIRKIERYIDLCVHDPDLNPQEIATTFGLSRSALYRAFAGHGGVARYIKQRRLARAHQWLLSAPPDQSVIAQLESFGYRTPTQFWRNFREEFGYSPGFVRSADEEADAEERSMGRNSRASFAGSLPELAR